jgi:trigger factor
VSQVDEAENTKDGAEVETDQELEGLKAVLKEGQSWTRFLEIELPAESVTAAIDPAYEEFRRKARIAGFRPGKAPTSLIKQMYTSEIMKDVLESLVPRAYEQALVRENLVPLNSPKISDLEFEAGKPLRFKAEFEIRPKVTLNKYTGFRVEKKVPEVTEKDIEDSLLYLKEKLAEFFPVQRPAEDGDLVIADLIKKHDKFGRLKEDKLENVEIELGGKRILEEFQRGVLGMRIGEMKDISVKYPRDYYDSKLAGDQILYLVVVKEIKKKVLPELNDEFARKVSKSETLAELREKMKAGLERQARDDATVNLRNEIIKRVIDANYFDVPVSLLNKYLDGVVEDFRKRGAAIDDGDIRTEYRQHGENLIRWGYLYYEIARLENIKVEPEDRRKWVDKFARTYGMSEDEARERLGKARKQEDMDDSIIEDKVLQFIIDKSEVLTSK